MLKLGNSYSKVIRRYKHADVVDKKKSYSNTVLLPQTKLPLRLANKKLVERDESLSSSPAFVDLYKSQKGINSEFILHDGPPYANGALHMGHAINKIVKDTIIRHKLLQNKKVSYVPGWDCHGLPIELKAIKDAKNMNPIEIRTRARDFAKETIINQKTTFESWGVTGDWNNAYMTFSNAYVKNQMKVFYKLHEKKLIYRDIKPVYWSPSTRTALAEAELEYKNDHISKAVYVKLKIVNPPLALGNDKKDAYALIWTTTPWTLPSNQAICFNPKLSYSLVQNSDSLETWIVATNLITNLEKVFNVSLNIVNTFSGELLGNATYYHPLIPNEILPFLPADHASETKGTGLVHTAPAHGLDDYNTTLKYKIPIKNYVDEDGKYTADAGLTLKGLSVLSDGTEAVLQLLQNNVVHTELYTHSYPYDWRTKQPVILRSSKQWFIDTDALKDRAISLLDQVQVFPKSRSEIYKRNLINQLQKRPSWCISRQRTWGVPIPVFYDTESGKPILERNIIEHLCTLIDEHGTDYWWNLKEENLLPKKLLLECNINSNSIVKGNDIFDIWFDSGLSWLNVFKNEEVVDVYVEGVDQFTGWFQSSLITSVALRDKSPYKSIYVHGFAVDGNGLKMSKSLGNIVDPQDIIKGKKGQNAYGIDTLRWWVVCHANSEAVAQISKTVLQASSDEVQKVRSVLRFAIGAVHDYKQQDIDYNNLLIIDKYLLHVLSILKQQILELYETYELNNKLSSLIINFLSGPVSALYYLAIKDRLYCNEADSLGRRSAQYVLLEIIQTVTECIAPIVPHLAEELYSHLPQKRNGYFFQNMRISHNLEWQNLKLADVVENLILNIKKDIHKNVGSDTLSLDVEIKLSEDLLVNIQEFQSDLSKLCEELVDILQVSKVDIIKCDDLDKDTYSLSISDSDLFMCDRCRRVFSYTETELCNRCNYIVKGLCNKTAFVN